MGQVYANKPQPIDALKVNISLICKPELVLDLSDSRHPAILR